jgi:alkylation response protein AidB-like acyl-CoA dehydrogenase
LPIVWYGNEAQKEKYLPKIASGEYVCSYCLTEPTSGSDANSGKTNAVLNEAGTHYLLNGQKMWITNGGFADIFIVFAKIEKDSKLSAFIVEKEFGGIELGKEEKKMGIKASSTVQVFFNNCPVPIENLLGEREKGFNMALNILNSGQFLNMELLNTKWRNKLLEFMLLRRLLIVVARISMMLLMLWLAKEWINKKLP